MTPLTITLFLAQGDKKGLRTAEIANWVGKLTAGPRTELQEIVSRCSDRPGVYILVGYDEKQASQVAYVGESESLGSRLNQHDRSRKKWDEAVALYSKDDGLTKSHIRYLEGRLIEKATAANRYILSNRACAFRGLPEPDEVAMDTFLKYSELLLPLLGYELLIPIAENNALLQQDPPKALPEPDISKYTSADFTF